MLNLKNKILLIILILLSSLTLGTSQPPITEGKLSEGLSEPKVEVKKLDTRAQILAEYFRQYSSPLEYQAQDFIDAADAYGVDWKLVPSIAGVESTFGKFIPGGHGPYISYNAWGWGVYGTQSLGFSSWRDGIFTVTKGLKERYIDRGLTNPYSMNHVYAASPTWGSRVSGFLIDLDSFSKTYKPEELKYQSVVDTEVKVAGSSAKLASL